MFHKKTFFLLALFFLIAQAAVCAVVLFRQPKEKLDIIAVNDIVQSCITDASVGNMVVEKVKIYNDTMEQKADQGEMLCLLFLCSMSLEIGLFYIYFYKINSMVFQPFEKLKNFAVRVAGGDLDLPLEMDRSNVFGAFTESFDLMREELKWAHKKERDANQSKKELIAKLSHDIKTPVASIKAVAELMLVCAKGEKEVNQLTIIGSKADQIDELISDLFHATIEELQELTVTPKEYGSRELLELFSNADYLKMAEIKEIPDCLLYFDKQRLQQVFDNIFGNSYKYAGTSILAAAFIEDGMLNVRIQDFGSGVLAEELPLVFEKFYRGKDSKDKSGVGLGLFISRYLMQKMEGNILCEEVSKGFALIISIRLA